MPKSNEKESEMENELHKQKVSIKAEVDQGQEAGRSGRGLLKDIVNFIKGIAYAIFDMLQQGHRGKETDQRGSDLQNEWLNSSGNQGTGVEQVTEKDQKIFLQRQSRK
ncbi:hypothetical protein [Wolbachia endosymbiont of Cantharis cryptica]|uniref:hypothetical protein n=1 Tax=Wolbachia endosymbiont of Cantharis cryptica TaxID=3066132 RepID=UPI00376EB0E8